MLITEDSYVKKTITVGTNSANTSSNITIYGADDAPYISIGQITKEFRQDGIFLGMGVAALGSPIAKLSLKGENGALS